MTKPALLSRSALLRSCAPVAFAVAAVAAPQSSLAQAFRATPEVIQGSVTIDREFSGIDDIQVTGFDAIIDWDPDQINGAADIFLPDGNTAIFRSGDGDAGFAVLNRIQTTPITTPAVFAGTVQAFLTDAVGNTAGPGGFVAFYSPTGIVVSGTAVFQVPQLMLSTNDIDPASFTDFATGAGPLLLSGAPSSISIQPGATLTGSPENSFFVVSSSNIDMGGDAYFNGSTAYVGAVEAQLTHSSGLFDIVIPFAGGSEGLSIAHTGSTGGPDSTGPGDNHIIYGVTSAASGSQLGVTALFSGNLGFDPAGAATVSDGEVILSAGYDVAQREIDGGQTGQGANSFFNGKTGIPFSTADIIISDLTASSNVTAISTHRTIVDTMAGGVDLAGDFVAVGRDQAIIDANGFGVDISGELYLSANDFGEVGNSFPTGVQGGLALVRAGPDGRVNVGGAGTVTTSGYAEVDSDFIFLGSAAGGVAQVLAEGGSISFGGPTSVEANGNFESISNLEFAGFFDGGLVEFLASDGGDIVVGSSLTLEAFAISPTLDGPNPDVPGSAVGGSIDVGTGTNGGIVSIGGQLFANASASGGDGVSFDNSGAFATGGTISIAVTPGSDFDVGSDTFLFADAFAGSVSGFADGGTAVGGNISIVAQDDTLFDGQLYIQNVAEGGAGALGGTANGGSTLLSATAASLTINGAFEILGVAVGGAGLGTGPGGNALGGDVLVEALSGGQILIPASDATINVSASGGFASSGPGGDADIGAFQFILNDGLVDIGGDLSITASVQGGASDEDAGGDGLNNGSLTLDLDAGSTLAVGGALEFASDGTGGDGLLGGNGAGGVSSFNIRNDSTLDAGSIAFSAAGVGGNGSSGAGGDGTGGAVSVIVTGGQLVAGDTSLASRGEGGDATGGTGGTGTGGTVQLINEGGSITANALVELAAIGVGGAGDIGGDASGGSATILVDQGGSFSQSGGSSELIVDALGGSGTSAGGNALSGDATVSVINGSQADLANDLFFSGIGFGGDSSTGIGGDGASSLNSLVLQVGSGTVVTIAGKYSQSAIGIGGNGVNGGAGSGGAAITEIEADATLDLDAANISAGGFGGDATSGTGGIGTGGVIDILLAPGAVLNAASNVELVAAGQGGSSVDGTGGDAFGGDVLVDVDNATVDLDGDLVLDGAGRGGSSGGSGFGGTAQFQIVDSAADLGGIEFSTLASSGGSDVGDGGAAQAGDNIFSITNSAVTSGDIVMENTATGNASPTGGNAVGGLQSIALDNSSLTGAGLFLYGSAVSSSDGAATTASDSIVTLANGSSASFTATYAEASTAAGNAAATANTSANITFEILDTGAPSTLSLGVTELYLDAAGGATNVAGSFDFLAPTGSITMQSLDLSALGDEGAEFNSTFSATGGDIFIADFATVSMTDDLLLEYANGGTIVGGSSLADLTAAFDFSSQGTVFIEGDDASAPSIGSGSLNLTSLDIEVGPLAAIAAQTVEITSLDDVHTNIIGGSTQGSGWTLTEAEAAAFDATSITLRTPATPSDVDVEIRDIQLFGSENGNLENFTVITPGTLVVVGQIAFDDVGANDTLELSAGETIQVILPDGGISLTDSDGSLSGTLSLSANGVLMTTSDIAARILADPLDAAIPDLLVDFAATGVSGPYSYIKAGSVGISAIEFVYGQNTGDAENFAGIEVLLGGGGLSIGNPDAQPGDPLLSTIAFGRATDANGNLQVNDDFFFATQASGNLSGPFTDGSTLNDCIINTASCGFVTLVPIPPIIRVLVPEEQIPAALRAIIPPNVTLLEEPLEEDEIDQEEETARVSEPASDRRFGVDFPALFSAPIIEEDERITDSVTSGGDSALYSLGSRGTADDENGDDDGGED